MEKGKKGNGVNNLVFAVLMHLGWPGYLITYSSWAASILNTTLGIYILGPSAAHPQLSSNAFRKGILASMWASPISSVKVGGGKEQWGQLTIRIKWCPDWATVLHGVCYKLDTLYKDFKKQINIPDLVSDTRQDHNTVYSWWKLIFF